MAINLTGKNEIVYKVLLQTELSGATNRIYALSHAVGGTSAWSFGAPQFDMGDEANPTTGPTYGKATELFENILSNAKNSTGEFIIKNLTSGSPPVVVSREERIRRFCETARSQTGAFSSAELGLIDLALSSNYGVNAIDTATTEYIAKIVERVDQVIPSTLDANSNLAFALLADYHNQLNISPGGNAEQYLDGEVAENTRGNVEIEGNFGVSDWLRFRFTQFWGSTSSGFHDVQRRLSEIENLYPYAPISAEDALEMVRMWADYKPSYASSVDIAAIQSVFINPAINFLTANYSLNNEITNVAVGINEVGNGHNSSNDLFSPNQSNASFKTGELSDLVISRGGDDSILAAGGNDVIYAGEGVDTVDGGDGDDHIFGGEGNDSIKGSSGLDNLWGDAGRDTLIGGVGNDYLNGGAGADIMQGGQDNDTYVVDSGSDQVVEDVASGRDEILSSVTVTISANVENLTLLGNESINGTGNELNNVVKGNDSSNNLKGESGTDQLYGNGGSDLLEGGIGGDAIYGGDGRDTLSGGTATDYTDTVTDFMDGGDGYDLYRAGRNDVINDSHGNGQVYFAGGYLKGGVHNEEDPENVYRSENGNYTYELLNGNLVVNNSLVIQAFTEGELGISLTDESDEPDDPLPPTPPQPPRNLDPLAFDLDGDGVETVSISHGVYFDHDNNGFREATSWVGGDDGLLAFDRNSNGKIDGGSELFGNYTQLADGSYAEHGFVPLAELDSNGDKQISSLDSQFSLLSVWRDRNSNGLTDSGELVRLQSQGIVSVNLDYSESTKIDANDVGHFQNSSFLMSSNTSSTITCLWFNRDTTSSVPVNPIDDSVVFSDEIEVLPDMRGYGNIRSLHEAMYSDASGELRSLVRQFMDETDHSVQRTLVEEILLKWTGCENVTSDSVIAGLSGVYDAREVRVSEVIWGRSVGELIQSFTSGNVTSSATRTYNQMVNILYTGLAKEGHLGWLYDLVQFTNTPRLAANFSLVYPALVEYVSSSNIENANGIIEQFAQLMSSYGFGDLGFREGFQTYLHSIPFDQEKLFPFLPHGGIGSDMIYGSMLNDHLLAFDGNDTVFGGTGNDIIHGGADDDVMEGGSGNDVYYFDLNDGRDTVKNGSSFAQDVDVIQFGEGITPESVILSSDQSGNLRIDIDENNSITISGYLLNSLNGVEEFRFQNGTIWNTSNIVSQLYQGNASSQQLYGTTAADTMYGAGGDDSMNGGSGNDVVMGQEGNDSISGSSGNDSLLGGVGNDVLGYQGPHYNESGNDTIDGGQGDDTIYGDVGNDTYIYRSTDGFDTIEDSVGLNDIRISGAARGEISFRKGSSPYDVIISIRGVDHILYKDAVGYSENTATAMRFDRITLDDNTVILSNDIISALNSQGVTNEYLFTLASGSNLDGGTGNDTLAGSVGNDTLAGGVGEDRIVSGAGNDFVSGGNEDDEIYAGIGNDSINGGAGGDEIDAGSGDDTVFGGDGDDGIVLGDGNDYVNPGAGNDYISANSSVSSNRIDTAYYQRGGGTDVLRGFTHLILDASISVSSLTYFRNGNSLALIVDGKKDDAVVLIDYFTTHPVTISFQSGGVLPSALPLSTGLIINENSSLYDENNRVISMSGSRISFDEKVGSANADWLAASTGIVYSNNTMQSGRTGSIVRAGDGNDSIRGGAGDDVMYGGAGSDTYYLKGDFGNDIIYDTAGAGVSNRVVFVDGVNPEDILIGRMDGDSGNWLGIFSKTNRNLLGVGGVGSISTIEFSNGTIWGASEIQTRLNSPQFVSGFYEIGSIEKIGLYSGNLSGTSAGDYLIGANFDRNNISSAAGNDTIVVVGGNSVVDASDGQDTVFGADLLLGSFGDSLLGGLGNDLLYGYRGFDTLVGGAGADTLIGGEGADFYYIDNVNDMIVETADGYRSSVVSSIDFLLASGFVNLTLTDSAQLGTGSVDDNAISGNNIANLLDGKDGWDTLVGGGGNDTLLGDIGNDLLDGGVGSDSMMGGSGDDVYRIDSASDVVLEAWQQGIDRVESSVNFSLGENLESLTLMGVAAQGSGNSLNNHLIGNAAANTLLGLQGNDTLDGGLGNDILQGGEGNDLYVVDSAQDVIVEGSNLGTDSVRTTINYTLGSHLENLMLNGSVGGTLTAFGNDGDNLIECVGSGYYSISGAGGSDTLVGGKAGDTLSGGAGVDYLSGASGDDTYLISAGDPEDILIELYDQGVDTVVSEIDISLAKNIENIVLTGTLATQGIGNSLSNSMLGNSLNNQLFGLVGDDTLIGGVGDDTMDGGTGYDRYQVDSAGDVIIEHINNGVDTIDASISIDLKANYANIENVVLVGNASLNISGNKLNNSLTGNSAANVLEGGAGVDSLVGGGGADTYVFGIGDGVDTISDTDANLANRDKLVFEDNITKENLWFSRSGNSLVITRVSSGDKVNISNWYSGTNYRIEEFVLFNATLDASKVDGLVAAMSAYPVPGLGQSLSQATKDALAPVLQANWVSVTSNAPPVLNQAIADTTAYEDTAFVFSIPAGAFVDPEGGALTYTATLENGSALPAWLSFNGSRFTGTPAASQLGSLNIRVTASDSSGASISDVFVLRVDAQNLSITGTAENNVLTGKSGNDTIDGLAGADQLSGKAGNDTYYVDNAGDVIVELAAEGIDTIASLITYTLANNTENLTLLGTATINATGNTLGNVLIGNSANNILDGLAGSDSMRGGAGNDTYRVDNIADVVTELAAEGTDIVSSSINYTLGDNLETLVLSDSAAISGVGNALNNTLTGNTGANTLNGGAGNDTISGSGGVDTVIGGAGNDLFYVDSAQDVVVEILAEGTDTIRTSVTFTLSDNVENLTLTGSSAISGTGNGLNNLLAGNSGANALGGGAGNDSISGGAGVDTMSGGVGNDVYTVDDVADVVIELTNEGADLVNSAVTFTLSNNVENLTLIGSALINGTGNTLNNSLTGNAVANSLLGAAGNDSLNGGAGADSMFGGAGNDTYTVDNIADIITELAGEGLDLVNSSVSFSLANNVENLTLSGTTSISATGNSLANVLTGNAVANTLTGGAGNDTLDGASGSDTMVGGSGDDLYIVNATLDVVTELAGEGVDTIHSSTTLTLASQVENITLTGTASINGTGNALNNILVGNTANNLLSGGDGNDNLDGGAGVDSLVGGLGNDTYMLGRGYGADIVTENDSTSGNQDLVRFMSGVNEDQVWFRRINSADLEVSIIGTSDRLTLSGWYNGNQAHAEQFITSAGSTLLDSQVQNLVTAMAAFAPPAVGETVLSQSYQNALSGVIAANWN